MSKEYTQAIDPTESATSKGAYMVYDHCEDENKTIQMNNNATFAAIELTFLVCVTAFIIVYSIF
jgi:hypothetical protein